MKVKKIVLKFSAIMFSLLAIMMVPYSVSSNILSSDSNLSGGDWTDVIETHSALESDVIARYAGKDDFQILSYNKVILPSVNFAQGTLNYYANELYATIGITHNGQILEVSGTCTQVAATIHALNNTYFNILGFNNNAAENSPARGVFADIVMHAVNSDWYITLDEDPNGLGGTYNQYVDDVLWVAYIERSENVVTTIDNYDVYTGLVNKINNNEYTVFNIDGHTMVGCGYEEVNVTYTQMEGVWPFRKRVTKYATLEYVVVNDGWYNSISDENTTNTTTLDLTYSYFPKDKITEENGLEQLIGTKNSHFIVYTN